MDILLGDDANGFDLLIDDTGDLSLALSNEQRILNSIKIALFSQDNWQAKDLLKFPLSSILEEVSRLAVNEQNRAYLEREIQSLLNFLVEENMVSSIIADVKIRNNRNYIFRLVIDGESIDISSLLEVRE